MKPTEKRVRSAEDRAEADNYSPLRAIIDPTISREEGPGEIGDHAQGRLPRQTAALGRDLRAGTSYGPTGVRSRGARPNGPEPLIIQQFSRALSAVV
jgi:hypothetical protein